MTALKLYRSINFMGREEADAFLGNIVGKSVNGCFKVIKTASFCFLYPCVAVAVAVENDSLVVFVNSLNKLVELS